MTDFSCVFDAAIVGAGPAGLAAAIYLGRYLRPTLLLNEKEPSTHWHRPTAHNVLGFPAGILRNQLLEWGQAHVAQYPCVVGRLATIERITREQELFALCDATGQTYRARSIILATGVEYELPALPDIHAYAGHSIYHCPECDGFKCLDQHVAIIGHGPGTAELALRLLVWTRHLTILTHGHPPELNAEAASKLAAQNIPIYTARITAIRGLPHEGLISGLILENAPDVPCTAAFCNIPCTPPSDLYSQLGLEIHKGRWVKVDYRQQTNVPLCYAAGDIVAFAQTQLSVAMGQGATAAINLHQDLLPEELKLFSS